MREWGLAGPGLFIASTQDGLAELKPPNSSADPITESLPSHREATLRRDEMQRPWLIISFSGSYGWDAWDCPWLVVLQHRPNEITLNRDGLQLLFAGEAGFVALMPIQGAAKLKPPMSGAETPRDSQLQVPLAERWTSVLRFWPVNCREEFQVLPAQDLLRVRGRYTYVEIEDDWNTTGTKLAPLPPTLALALESGFPARLVEERLEDLEVPTAYGPYWGVSGDTYTIEFSLKRLNHTETQQPPNMDDRIVAIAVQQVAQRMEQKFIDGNEERIWDHGGGNNYCWQVMGDRWYAKALAYTPETAREHAKACLAAYVRNWVLNETKYKPFRGKLILEGPGIGNWGGYDDSGKFSSNILETLWCYAYHTGDWDIIRQRWDTIQKLFVTPRECRWRGFGRDAIAEMGDEAAPPMCLARMAHQIGDLDTYAYAAYIYARECVHLWVKTKPECAEWFRSRQPWHSSEPMEGPLWLTNLWGDVAGWQIDGPDYPKETGERQYMNRWVRFSNEDVGAFMRESLGEEVLRQELDWWLTREDNPYKPGVSTAHIAPSMEQLRSLLLNESPAELAKLAPMDNVRIGRPADAISYYMAFVRTGWPIRHTRLVPTSLPTSPWMLGLERESDGSDGALVVNVLTKGGHWPTVCDWGWKPPREAGDLPGAERWPYGQIITGDVPPTLKWERLSWVTNVQYAP